VAGYNFLYVIKEADMTFLQEPAERPYGIEALFRDDSGNWFSLTRSKYETAQKG
jgi:hypothetical protein